jgi:hypothetical protein
MEDKMIDRFDQRLKYVWQVCRWPVSAEFERLPEIAQGTGLDSLLLLLLGAVVILFGVAGFSGVQVQLLELLAFAIGLMLGFMLWSTVASLYARLLGGRADNLFGSFLYMTSSALLALLVAAIFVSYLPFIGSLVGLALLLYSQVLVVLTYRHYAGVGWLLSILGTLATGVVSIGLFQLAGRWLFSLLAGPGF